jgi:aspartyl-tRNA(Asn)/glutamyl-tRNA(Gln) amidotransferase subunit A
VITLKEALTLSKEELNALKKEIVQESKKHSALGGYIEQLTGMDFHELGSGVPIAIKDNIQVKEWPVTCSSNILQCYRSSYNATIIDKMLASNLSPFGRCNMDEFAMGSSTETSFYGTTCNPHDASRVPGGSSGGSAAVVGAGLAVASLGSDTGGSIRQPAAFCGVVGMKPTYGRVSRYGLTAFSSSLDQIGPITQNVEDAAILYDILAGHDAKDSTSANLPCEKTHRNLDPDRKLTIAVIENYLDDADAEVKSKLKESIKALKEAGHTIIYKTMMNSMYDVSAYYIVATAEASANLSRFDGIRYGNRAKDTRNLEELYKMTKSQGFGDEVQRRVLLGSFVLSSGYYDAYYIKAQKVRHLIKDQYEKIFDEADLIFTPVTPTTAFELDSKKDPLEMYLSDIYTISVNLAGLPAISVPVGKDTKGLPIGAQLIAKAFGEQTLFDGAMSLERAVKE